MAEDNNNIQEYNDESREVPPEIEELLDSIPEDKRALIERTLVAGFSMVGQNSPASAIAKKLTPDHIDKFLDMSQSDMEHHYKEKNYTKFFVLSILVAAFIFFLILVNMLKTNTVVLEKIITSIVSLLGGAIGGYGLGKTKKED